MIEEFTIDKYNDNSLLRCILNDIVSAKFFKYTREEKMNLLIGLDNCISQLTGIPVGVFVNDKESDNIDDLNIGDIDSYNFGMKVLHAYFYNKRQQYQKYWIKNNDKAIYSEDEFDILKYNYIGTPISNKKLQTKGLSTVDNYVINYNKSDAYVYACREVSNVINLVDYSDLFSSYDIFETLKFIFYTKNTLKSYHLMMERMKRKIANNRWQKKYVSLIDDYEVSLDRERQFLSVLNIRLMNKDYDDYLDYVLACFDENIWENLSLYGKFSAVEGLCSFFQECFKMDPKIIDESDCKMISSKRHFISVGDLNIKRAKDVFNSVVYSYALDCYNKDDEYVESIKRLEKMKDYKNIKLTEDNKVVKEVSKIAVGFQKIIYKFVKNSTTLKTYEIDFLGKEIDFVYDLYKSSKNKGGRK